MRCKRDFHSIKTGRAKGRKDPEWFVNYPRLLPGERLLIVAFWDLDTCRSANDLTLGRIPWTAAMEYVSRQLKWDEEMHDPFWRIIYAMDSGYLKWMKEEHDDAVAAQRTSASMAPRELPDGRTKHWR